MTFSVFYVVASIVRFAALACWYWPVIRLILNLPSYAPTIRNAVRAASNSIATHYAELGVWFVELYGNAVPCTASHRLSDEKLDRVLAAIVRMEGELDRRDVREMSTESGWFATVVGFVLVPDQEETRKIAIHDLKLHI
ncbi:hypothetical protein C8R46DRAFT_1029330 [Mycena filopes]|nr:hypothetical protein C8R46DRAFT_1029330 [Mycena filopes]